MFGMSLNEKIGFANQCKPLFSNFGSSTNNTNTSSKPTSAGLSYHQGYTDGRSTSMGYDKVTSGELGSTIGSITYAHLNNTMNSYNKGYTNGLKDK